MPKFSAPGVTAARIAAVETAVGRLDMDVQVESPSSGATVTSNGANLLALNHPALISLLTVAFPASPRNGQQFNIASKSVVTTLTLSSAQTILGPLTTIAALGYARYVYSTAIAAWLRAG